MMKFHYHYCFSPKLIIHSQKFTNFYIEHNYTCTSSQFHYLSHSSLTTFDTWSLIACNYVLIDNNLMIYRLYFLFYKHA